MLSEHDKKDLVEAVIGYGIEHHWGSYRSTELLVKCGIEKPDFERTGYGDFVRNYFYK